MITLVLLYITCSRTIFCSSCRAKLAEWLASKGKTFKRPAMTTAAPSKPKVSAKPEADLKPQSHADPQPAAQCKPEPSVEAHESDSAAAHCADTQGAGLMIHSQTPNPDPQDRADDVRKRALFVLLCIVFFFEILP